MPVGKCLGAVIVWLLCVICAHAAPVAVTEYYNARLDHYFVTWSPDEIDKLDRGVLSGWARTGLSFAAFGSPAAGASPVCRIYIPPAKGDGHYFGRDPVECNGTMAKNPSFILESADVFQLYLPVLFEVVNSRSASGPGNVVGILSWGYWFTDNPLEWVDQANNITHTSPMAYDKSSSIRGKPAEAVVRWWFDKF